jgi:hypothetical protein
LLQGGDARQQGAQHVGLLKHRARGQFPTIERVNALDEGLKNLSCASLLHG